MLDVVELTEHDRHQREVFDLDESQSMPCSMSASSVFTRPPAASSQLTTNNSSSSRQVRGHVTANMTRQLRHLVVTCGHLLVSRVKIMAAAGKL